MLPLGDFINAFRFSVKIDNLPGVPVLKVDMPEVKVETEDVREGGFQGFVHQLPTRITYGSLKLKTAMTPETLPLMRWYQQTQDPKKWQSARRTLTLFLHAPIGAPLMMWTFNNAFPRAMTMSGFDSSSSEYVGIDYEITFTDYEGGPIGT